MSSSLQSATWLSSSLPVRCDFPPFSHSASAILTFSLFLELAKVTLPLVLESYSFRLECFLTPVFRKPGSFPVIQITASKRAFLAFESKVTQTCNRTSPHFLSIAVVSDIFLICIPVFVFLCYSIYGKKRVPRLLPTIYVPPSIVLGIYMSHSTNIYWMRKGKKIELPVDGRSSKIRGLIKS